MIVASFGVRVEAKEKVEVAVVKLLTVWESLVVVGQGKHPLHQRPNLKIHHQSLP